MSNPTPGPPGDSGTFPESEKGSSVSRTALAPPIPFTEQLLERVRDFHCGDEAYEVEVAQYIKSPRGTGSALDDMVNNGTQVFLYETLAGELVGYGSLGTTLWRWDNPKKGPWTPIYIIPFYGVQSSFKGQPPGPKEHRYARRIFEDLLARAVEHPERRRLLGLCVHPQNVRAIKVYRDYGFMDYGTTSRATYA